MRIEEWDPMHRDALAVALGLEAPFKLLHAFVPSGDPSYFGVLGGGENDGDAEVAARQIEEAVKRLDASFALSSAESEQIAISLVEDQCRILLSGAGDPQKLKRALREIDRVFGAPAWIGDDMRRMAHDKRGPIDARFVDALAALLRRIEGADERS